MIEKYDFGLCFLHSVENNIKSIVTKIYEYMSKSIPIIASDFPHWKKYFNDNKCGLNIDIMNLKSEKNKILNFLLDIDKINDMKNSIIKNVHEYTWENEFKHVIQEYQKLLKNK